MNKEKFSKLLVKIGACNKAKDWIENNKETNLKKLWLSCERGDWMLWLLAKLNADRKRVVWSACQCARLSLQFIEDGEDRPRIAIETAEKWYNGEATLEEVNAAAYAAYAAAAAAYAAAAAAYAAAGAAYAAADDAAAAAAYAAAYAAAGAAYAAADDAAAAAAYAAADDAAAYAARKEWLLKCANIIRDNFEFEYIMELLKDD